MPYQYSIIICIYFPSLILITFDLVQKPLSSHMTVTGCGFEIHPCNINILGIVYPLSFPSLIDYVFLITIDLTLIQKAFVFSSDSMLTCMHAVNLVHVYMYAQRHTLLFCHLERKWGVIIFCFIHLAESIKLRGCFSHFELGLDYGIFYVK